MDHKLRQKIGQMIIAGFPSLQVDDQARRLVSEYSVGNFVLFGRNFSTLRQACDLCEGLSALAFEGTGLAPLIAADQEGGAVTRLREGAALFPGAMALAAARGKDVYRVGKNCGEILRAVGVNTNFAPVLDVNIEAKNPIIGARAFSDDPWMVSRLGLDMLAGMKDGGLLAAVKHYPGHGNVKSDSHLGIPENDTPSDLLNATEWIPFQNAFRAGAEALMTAHVRYNDVDPEYPATLSRKIMTTMLREKQNFQGLVLTDCLEMDAVRAAYGIGEGAVLAVEAGCDLLTFSHTIEAVAEAVQAIYKAVESGRLSVERIDRSYHRILEVKEKYGLTVPFVPNREKAVHFAYDPEKIALHARLARESITLLSGKAVNLENKKAVKFFAPASLALTGAEDLHKNPLSFALQAEQRFGGTAVQTPLDGLDAKTLEEIDADNYELAVLGLYNARFRAGQQELLRALEKSGKTLVVVLLGAPYDAVLVKRSDAVIAAYEYTALSVSAVLDALEEQRFPGQCPVGI